MAEREKWHWQEPGYFRVQKDIEIGDRKYDGVGNVVLLMAEEICKYLNETRTDA